MPHCVQPVVFLNVIDSSVEVFSAALQVLKHDWSHKRPKMCLRQGPSSGVKHENAFW